MRTTIDAAGRIAVPKCARDAMGLTAGTAVEVVFTNGRVEIEPASADVTVGFDDGLPRLVPTGALAGLTDEQVREALEGTRR